MNRRVYGCCGSGGVVVQAERFVEVHGGERRAAAADIGLEPSHLSAQLRGLGRAGLGPQQQTGTTVTYTLSHPPVVDPLTITRSRLHKVINDRMESLTELQPISPTSECPEQG